MLQLQGYEFTEELHNGVNSIVYRGRSLRDGSGAILKVLRKEYPPPERIAQFKREFEVLRSLELPGVVRAHALERMGSRWGMILEDFGGHSLRQLKLGGTLSLEEFLSLAIRLASILEALHERRVIHKDVNAFNIVLNPATGEVKLIDFGICTVLSHERPLFHNPTTEGTLAYISPEQTGRMNRPVDHRTDLYSLGITLYELLTGQLPFMEQDALALVHSHIAKAPPPPSKLVAGLPPVVSDIILKLMAKDAEARYQSAHGLKEDLRRCLEQLQGGGTVESFPLAERDVSSRFHLPQRLYGREKEVETLLAAFERTAGGASELMLVAGYSGVGKSVLVQEVYRPITQRRGYFISGKFDQFQRDIPYSALVEAFRSLLSQLLSESEQQMAQWRARLLEALGTNGRVITEVLPELELLIGPQPEVPALGPAEAQKRFHVILQSFIRVFTRPEHPLVLFLDDLQWADGASLSLLELLVTAPGRGWLFVIGAYRDNEVSAVHPLSVVLRATQESGATIQRMTLSPLGRDDVRQLVADALHSTPQAVAPLADLALAKTGGNPFFLNEFLKTLDAERLLRFEPAHGQWQWSLAEIEAKTVTHNVVELLVDKIRKQPGPTQELLQLAACIGGRFELNVLALVSGRKPQEVARALRAAITEELLLPLSNHWTCFEQDVEGLSETVGTEYRFAHDRVQQAAYFLIPEQQRQEVHWRLGVILFERTAPAQLHARLFDIVNQLNQGRQLAQRPEEKARLLDLNVRAGRRARATIAFDAAFHYFSTAIELLTGGTSAEAVRAAWKQQPELALSLFVEATEAAYLSTRFDQLEQLAAVVLENSDSLATIKVHEVKIQACFARGQPLDSVRVGVAALARLGIQFPEQPSGADVGAAFGATSALLAGRNIDELSGLPLMSDPLQLARMRIMVALIPAAFIAVPTLFPLIVLTQVGLSVQHGNAGSSPVAYACYGLLLCGAFGDIGSGYRFGRLAAKLLEESTTRERHAMALVAYNCGSRHWKEHVRDTLLPLPGAYQTGVDTGDMEYAAIALQTYCNHSYFLGRELSEQERELRAHSEAMKQIRQERVHRLNEVYRQAVHNLMGRSADPCQLTGEVCVEEEVLRLHQQAQDRSGLCELYLHKLILHFLFHHPAEAVRYAELTLSTLDALPGFVHVPVACFYDSLAQLALYPSVPGSQQAELLEKVARNQEKLKGWAEHAPMNQRHRYLLVEAERARVTGKDGEAWQHYDQAIAQARQNGYLHEEALAHELAGRFYLSMGRIKVAQLYLQDARYAYQLWGASAKVQHLAREHGELLAQPVVSTASGGLKESWNSTSTTGELPLDLLTVMKASQTISSEIFMPELLKQMMGIVLENAGAERGFFILEKQEGRLFIEAAGNVSTGEVTVLQNVPVEGSDWLSTAVVSYVARTRRKVVLDDALREGFASDPYLARNAPRSLLCVPIRHRGNCIGILYLENNLVTNAFTPARLQMLELLCAQTGISLENATLYQTLEQKVDERTQQLRQKTDELQQALAELKQMQQRIIVQEKLASLGSLTSGIAHEIRNPINFVVNFAESSETMLEELGAGIAKGPAALMGQGQKDLKGLVSDLEENLGRIKSHGQRAESIIASMLQHANGGTSRPEPTELNALVEQMTVLVEHSARAQQGPRGITFERKLDSSLQLVRLMPLELGRALVNILNNACYSVQKKASAQAEGYVPTISILTRNLEREVEIRIWDNGLGIEPKARQRLFEPFFTTKPAGVGVGLGLSLSREIVVQQHGGQLECESVPGQYAEFIIRLPR